MVRALLVRLEVTAVLEVRTHYSLCLGRIRIREKLHLTNLVLLRQQNVGALVI